MKKIGSDAAANRGSHASRKPPGEAALSAGRVVLIVLGSVVALLAAALGALRGSQGRVPDPAPFRLPVRRRRGRGSDRHPFVCLIVLPQSGTIVSGAET